MTNFVSVANFTESEEIKKAVKLRKLFELLMLLYRLSNTEVILQVQSDGRLVYIEACYCSKSAACQGYEETSRAILAYESFNERYDVPSEILEMCLSFIRNTPSTMEPEQLGLRNCLYLNYSEETCDLDVVSKSDDERKLLAYVRMGIYEDEIPEFLLKSHVRVRAALLCNLAFAVTIPNHVFLQILWFLE